LLVAYNEFLFFERRSVTHALWPDHDGRARDQFVPCGMMGPAHRLRTTAVDGRAVAVLAAMGCSWPEITRRWEESIAEGMSW
jgi:hypothetical protein